MINVRHGPGPAGQPVEIVERQGLGHPDTLADALAERISVAYFPHSGSDRSAPRPPNATGCRAVCER
jgi:hypothetical protein